MHSSVLLVGKLTVSFCSSQVLNSAQLLFPISPDVYGFLLKKSLLVIYKKKIENNKHPVT